VTRVLIADDQPHARRSLTALLTVLSWSSEGRTEPPGGGGFATVEIVGGAESSHEAIVQVEALQPDVVVMDLQLLRKERDPEPHLDGLAAIRLIKRNWPLIRIVVLTMFATDRASVLTAGADAFLLKGCPTRELLDAVMPATPKSPGE
jgi:DNA-binding NarL/FixJ family response regulator